MTGSLRLSQERSRRVEAIPERWLSNLELRTTIEALADDLAAFPEWRVGGESDREERMFYTNRYPIA